MFIKRITVLDEDSQNIYLSDEAINNCRLHPENIVTIKSGSSKTLGVIKKTSRTNSISSRLLKILNLPKTKELIVKIISPKEIQIGPLIGIMISRGKKYKLPPYSSQGKLLKEFLNYSKEKGVMAYVFTPKSVDVNSKTISGLYLAENPEGKVFWKHRTFPLPDVVYDRILFRTIERKKLTKSISSFFIKENIFYFNPKFLSKWETHKILINKPLLQSYLPKTIIYKNAQDLLQFSDTYKTVYIKPVNGSLGKDIIRLNKTSEGYCYQYRTGKKITSGVWSTPEEMISGINNYIKNSTYILQQGLDLLKYRNRVFDIRVLMQKNGLGQWQTTAMVARIAAEGSIFPNVAAGGEPKDIETLWQELSSEDWRTSRTYNIIKHVSLVAANTLEEYLGTFGEIGLDIGIDVKGNIWIIEINSKPSRKVFPKNKLYLKTNSIKMPIDFATFLAGFSPVQGGVNCEKRC